MNLSYKKSAQALGCFLFFGGLAFNFAAVASILNRWDWGFDVSFHILLPIHAQGALYGFVAAIVGAFLLFNLHSGSKNDRSILSGLLLGLIIASVFIWLNGPVSLS